MWLAIPLALVGVIGSLGAHHAQPVSRAMDVWGVLLALVAPASLVLLVPRRPAWAVLAAAAATGVWVGAGYPWSPVFLAPVAVLAAIVAWVPGRSARVLAGGGAILLFGTVAAAGAMRLDPPRLSVLLGAAAWATVIVLVANGARERRARFAEARAAAARSLAERQQTAVAAERLRIARELHDVLAHSLSAITVQAGVGLHLLDREPEQARAALTNIRATSTDALDEVRSVLGIVRAGSDDDAPLAPTWTVAALPRLVSLASTQRLTATLDVDPEAHTLPDHLAGVVYRVVQEALTNISRHAPAATRAEVRVAVTGSGTARSVVVQIDDDGGAAATPAIPSGYGLLGMRERLATVGGTADAGPTPTGWRVRAELPWPATPEAP